MIITFKNSNGDTISEVTMDDAPNEESIHFDDEGNVNDEGVTKFIHGMVREYQEAILPAWVRGAKEVFRQTNKGPSFLRDHKDNLETISVINVTVEHGNVISTYSYTKPITDEVIKELMDYAEKFYGKPFTVV